MTTRSPADFAAALANWDDHGDYTVVEYTPEEKAEREFIRSMHAAGKLSTKGLLFICRARIAVGNPEMNAQADEIIRDLVRRWGS